MSEQEKSVQEQVNEVVNGPNYYVAFHSKKGVFLGFKEGKPRWSNDPGMTGQELAPAFEGRDGKEAFAKVMREVDKECGQPDWWPLAVQLRLVNPTANDAGQPAATRENCNNMGLPWWGPK